MALPFGMGPYEYLTFVSKTAGGYPYLTVNGYNLWALIGAGGSGSLASDGLWSQDTIPLLGPIPGVLIGAALLRGGLRRRAVRAPSGATTERRSWSRRSCCRLPSSSCRRASTSATSSRSLRCCRSWPSWSRRWRWATLAFAIGSFINLHAILTNANPQYGTDNVASLPFGDLFRTFPFVGLAVILQTGAFVFAVWQLRGKHADLDQLIETPAQRHDGLAAIPGLAPGPDDARAAAVAGDQRVGRPAFSAAVPQPEGDSLYAAEAEAGAEAAELTAAEDAATLAGQEDDDERSDWPGWGTWIDGKLGTRPPGAPRPQRRADGRARGRGSIGSTR